VKDLFLHLPGDFVDGIFNESACIYQSKRAVLPDSFIDKTIPGNPLYIMNNGTLLPDNPVKEGGFSNIRSADYGDKRKRFFSSGFHVKRSPDLALRMREKSRSPARQLKKETESRRETHSIPGNR
jgi:hypothetical protein